MSKSNETNDFEDYFEINPKLRSYFGVVRHGQPEEYRTEFAEGLAPQEAIEKWKPTLLKECAQWPSLLEFEFDLARKVGPMSIMKPLPDRIEDIDSYYTSILKRSEPILSSALLAVVREFSNLRGLRPRSVGQTLSRMKLNTNSGSPYFTKRKQVVEQLSDSFPQELGTYPPEFVQEIGGKEWKLAAVLGWRGQEGGPSRDDVKQRVVWMFPFSVNVSELQVYQPLIELSQRFNLVPAWVSMEAVDDRITKLFDTKAKDDLIICTDFTKFDQHFNNSLVVAAKTILSRLLSGDRRSEMWLEQVFPIKYAIPLAYDYGKIRRGQHGMGSGSGGTNVDETIVHRALQYEAALSHAQRLNPNSQCLGDDGILSFPGITVDKVVESYARHGLDMNTDKQYAATDNCTYLRRWHHNDYRVNGRCVGVYSTCRALGRLMEQERYYNPKLWNSKMVALRQLSILENLRYHPARESFVNFCMKWDNYRFGLDIPGFFDNLEGAVDESMKLMDDFLGYVRSNMERTSINDWWIVKYLKSL